MMRHLTFLSVLLIVLLAPLGMAHAMTVWNGQNIYTPFYDANYYTASPTLKYYPFTNTNCYGMFIPCDYGPSGNAWGLPFKAAINDYDYRLYHTSPPDVDAFSVPDPNWNYSAGDPAGSYGGYYWQMLHSDSATANRACYVLDTTATASSWSTGSFDSPGDNSGLGWAGSGWHLYDPLGNANNQTLSNLVCTTSALPVNTLAASPTTINLGQSTTLTFDAGANADAQSTVCTPTNFTVPTHTDYKFSVYNVPQSGTYCEGYCFDYYIPGGWNASENGTKPDRSGSVTVSPTADTQYCYSCTNGNGTTNRCVTVSVTQPTPPATATLTPASQTITIGSSATLTWSSTNATSCTATGFTAGATSGSASVSPSVTTTYSLSCAGPGGTSAVQYATVTVTNPPLTPSCSPSTSGVGINQAMNWFGSASGGSGTGYTYSWSGTAPLAGMTGASPSVTYTSTGTKTGSVTVTDSLGATATASCSGSVQVYPAVSGTCSVSPASVTTGQSVTWTATPSGGTGIYTYSWSGSESLSGTAQSVAKSYASAGVKSAAVTITSGSQSTAVTCTGDAGGSGTVTVAALQANLSAGSVTPVSATAGSASTYSATITNTGNASTGSSYSNIFQFDSNVDHTTVDGTSVVSAGPTNASGGTSLATSASYTFAAAGTAYVRLCADNNASFVGTISESNEADNCGVWTAITVAAAPQADLTAGSVSPTSATQNVSTSFSGTVTNGGTAASGSFTSYLEVQGGSTYGTNALSLASGGGSGTASATITFASTGTFNVRLCADTVNAVSESNEANNCGSWTAVTVTAAAQPNLTAGTPTPTTAVAGVATTYTSIVSNTGGASSGAPFTDLIQRATDASGTGATDMGVFNNPTLASSGTTNATFSVTLAAGTWYLRGCADKQSSAGTGVINTESNEGDNCSAWTAVTVYPALAATCSVLPTTSITGQNVTWSAYASGGTGIYSYTWGGTAPLAGLTGSSNTITYSSAGTKTGSVTVTSGTQTVSAVACTANADGNGGTTDGPSVTVSLAQPDLTTAAATGPTTATVGVATNVIARVTNSGTASTGAGFTNKVQKATDASGTGATDVVTGAMGVLAASGFSDTGISYTFPAGDAGTTKYIRVCADSTSAITESSEANNCGAWTAVSVAAAPQADLTAGVVSPATATQNLAQSFSGTVTNGGTAASGSFTSYLEVQGGSTYGTNALSLASGGGSGTASANITFASVGSYNVRLCADTANVVSESNEANNCGAWTAVTVSAPSQPNLTAAAPSPTTATAGAATTYTSRITNGGTGATGGAFTDLIQRATDASGTGATDMTTYTNSAIAASGFTDATFSVTLAAGTWYLRVCGDKQSAAGTGVITESNEADNCSAWTAVTVTALQPNLTTGGVSPTTATASSATTFSATVTNNGNASTGIAFGTLLQKANDVLGTGSSDVTTGSLAAIAASGSAPANFSYTFPAGDGGTTKYLRVCADKSTAGDPGLVTESNEGDNCGAWTAITVSAPAVPTITSCTPVPAAANDNVNVTWTANVSGFSPAPTSYTWNVTGGTPASQSGASNTFVSQFTASGNYSPTVTATNGGQTAGPFSCSPVAITGTTCSQSPAPVIAASQTRVTSGSSVTISWSATGMPVGTSCTITGKDVGGAAVDSRTSSVSDSTCTVVSGGSSSVVITNVTGQRDYTITCNGTTAKVTVNIIPNFVEF